MEFQPISSPRSDSSDFDDKEDLVCPRSPKRRPFSIQMQGISPQEKLELLNPLEEPLILSVEKEGSHEKR